MVEGRGREAAVMGVEGLEGLGCTMWGSPTTFPSVDVDVFSVCCRSYTLNS